MSVAPKALPVAGKVGRLIFAGWAHELHMGDMGRRAALVASVGLAVVAMTSAGCTKASVTGGERPPLTTTALVPALPVSAPAVTQLRSTDAIQFCTVVSQPKSSTNAPISPADLPPNPAGVDAVQLPGLNDHTCKSGVVTAPTNLGDRLVADVNSLKVLPPGNHAYSCPSDDGHGIVLVFRYRQPSEALAIHVALAGCAFVDGLRQSRWQNSALIGDLHAFVPNTWF